LAIARAFLKDAPVLILDEPTSALDAGTEAHLLEALERLMVGRTTFIISHRLSMIRRADRIFVLNDGRVAEAGTREALLPEWDIPFFQFRAAALEPPAGEWGPVMNGMHFRVLTFALRRFGETIDWGQQVFQNRCDVETACDCRYRHCKSGRRSGFAEPVCLTRGLIELGHGSSLPRATYRRELVAALPGLRRWGADRLAAMRMDQSVRAIAQSAVRRAHSHAFFRAAAATPVQSLWSYVAHRARGGQFGLLSMYLTRVTAI
jgi:hypothetical protein